MQVRVWRTGPQGWGGSPAVVRRQILNTDSWARCASASSPIPFFCGDTSAALPTPVLLLFQRGSVISCEHPPHQQPQHAIGKSAC